MTATVAPVVMHVATTDMSLELLLGPQLSAFAAAGYRIIGASAPGPYVDALRDRGIEHVALGNATRAMSLGADARALTELVRVFRRHRPQIVHTHNPKPGVYGRVAARVARVPVIVNTVHGVYALPSDPLARRLPVWALERLAAACSHAELVQNEEDLALLRRLRVPDARLVLLGNGIDLTRFDPARFDATDAQRARCDLCGGELRADPHEVVVGAVGRLVHEKGYRELFAAARLLPPVVRLAVIGFDEPDKRDALTSDEIEAARATGVRFLGARHDVDRLYSGMDVFVLASHREGFPRAAMEAAAMGLPIVATDIRGCRQVVEHEVTGLLVPPRDPQALAAAVRRLADDRALRQMMGIAARRRALERFDQQRCVDTTLSVYDTLLRRRGIHSPAAARG
jgi:glycosyltransferase involved in cell wall biosynthesis